VLIYRRTDQSLIGKTHRQYLPTQRRNHQWNMVINNLTDDDTKPENYRYHRTSHTTKTKDHSGTGHNGVHSSVVKTKTKDHSGTVHSGVADDNDWTAAGRRLLLPADDTSSTSPVSGQHRVELS